MNFPRTFDIDLVDEDNSVIQILAKMGISAKKGTPSGGGSFYGYDVTIKNQQQLDKFIKWLEGPEGYGSKQDVKDTYPELYESRKMKIKKSVLQRIIKEEIAKLSPRQKVILRKKLVTEGWDQSATAAYNKALASAETVLAHLKTIKVKSIPTMTPKEADKFAEKLETLDDKNSQALLRLYDWFHARGMDSE
jgi:hypothetical protein